MKIEDRQDKFRISINNLVVDIYQDVYKGNLINLSKRDFFRNSNRI